MKKRDTLKELRGLAPADLRQRARGMSEELMKLRFRATTGQLEQTHRLRELRRNYARISSVLREAVLTGSKG